MPDEVKIPVSVKGAAEAQADLKRVSIQISELEAAEFKRWRANEARVSARSSAEAASMQAAQERKALNEIVAAEANTLDKNADASKRAGDATIDFHRKGEKLAKDMLGLINPELARMADLALNATEGVSRLSPALLAVAGVGATLGIMVAFFRDAADEAARLEKRIRGAIEAQAAMRGEGAGVRETMAGKLGEAGVFAGADAGAAAVQRLMRAGVNKELAEQAAVASVAGGLTPEQEMDAAAGLLTRGGQLPENMKGMTEERRKAAIAALVKAGQTQAARTALGGRILDTGDIARAQAPTDAGLAREGEDEALQRMKREAGLNDKDIELIRRVRALGHGATDADVRKIFGERVNWAESVWGKLRGGVLPLIRDETPEGGTRSVGEILNMAGQVRDEGGAREMGEAAARTFGGPVNIRVQNINTQHNQRDPFSVPANKSADMQDATGSF